MWWWLFVIGLLLLAALLVLFSVIRVRVWTMRSGENNDDEIEVSVSALYNLVRYTVRVPVVQLKPIVQGIALKVHSKKSGGASKKEEYTLPEARRTMDKIRTLLHHMNHYKDWLAGTLHHIHVTKLHWETRVGLGGAPETALSSGVLWSMKGTVIGQISRWVKLDRSPEIIVEPVFQQSMFHMKTDVRIRVRVVRLLVSVLALAARVVRKEGGVRVWLRVLRQTRHRGAANV